MSVSAIACTVCGMVSHHPMDVRKGYCGNCKMWRHAPGEAFTATAPDDCPDCPASLFYPSSPSLSIDVETMTATVSFTRCPHDPRAVDLVAFAPESAEAY